MDLRKICDSVDEQGWVKVAIKVANNKVDEAKTVLDQLGYTAYDIEGSGNDKVIKVSTQHPDETKAKLLPKLKEAGITPISTRVTDSNKRLDEYILGSLRANGIESAVNVEQHKDGFRVSLQGNTDVYLDIYLDGENVVVRGFDPDGIVNVTRYATFAGIPAEQAKQVIRKFEKWANKVAKLDARPVAELESVRVTDGLNIPAYSKKYIEDALWSALGLRVKVTTEDGRITIAIPNTPVGAGGYVVVAEVVSAGKSLKVRRDKDASKYKGNASIVSAVIDEAKEYFKSHPDFPFHVTDAGKDDGFSLSSVIKEALEATGTAGIFDTQLKEHGAVLESKESDAAVIIRKSSAGKSKYTVTYSGDTTPPKVAALLKSLRERLSTAPVKDSVEDLKLPKFSSNAKLNKLCTSLADSILAHFVDESTETMLSELQRYKSEFPKVPGYNFIQYGNTGIISYSDAQDELQNAGYTTKMSDTAAWDAVCRTMGQVIRTLLEHKEELLKQKVTDSLSSRARFLDGNDYIEIEDIVKRYYPNVRAIAGFGRGAGEISAVVRLHDKNTKENIGDFELTFDGRIIRKHGEDKLREMGDFDAMVEDLVANNPFKQYEAEIREKMNDTSRVYDSAKIKSASLRAALKKAGKLQDSVESESAVQSAIASAKLKVSAKMRAALMRLAKRKTPIERVEFKQERIASNIHDKDAYDYADVFYYHTPANKHATVSWDGEVHNAMN